MGVAGRITPQVGSLVVFASRRQLPSHLRQCPNSIHAFQHDIDIVIIG
jgi:hypothetical protein